MTWLRQINAVIVLTTGLWHDCSLGLTNFDASGLIAVKYAIMACNGKDADEEPCEANDGDCCVNWCHSVRCATARLKFIRDMTIIILGHALLAA